MALKNPATIFGEITVDMIDESVKFQNLLEKKERRVLFGTGNFGRAYLRQRIRRRKAVSAVNSYPSAHVSGATGLKAMRFHVNPWLQSVMIGPLKYPQKPRRPRPLGGKTVPSLLNEGGAATLDTPAGQVRLQYRPRPFRELAFPDIYSKFKEKLEKERL